MITHIAAYKFVSLQDLPQRKEQLFSTCKSLDLKGTILLSQEGINLMLAGQNSEIEQFQNYLREDSVFNDIEFKTTLSEQIPFKRLWVKLKKSIIPLRADVDPTVKTASYLAPQMLKQWLDDQKDLLLLDTRNNYEIAFGTFESAQHFNIRHFVEFTEATAKLDTAWKKKPVVMFCTGGIRCEKASAFFLEQGFEQVYQLHGGILNYFKECGGVHYQGDCYVFDERIALTPQLTTSHKSQCMKCSFPIEAKDIKESSNLLCDSCNVAPIVIPENA